MERESTRKTTKYGSCRKRGAGGKEREKQKMKQKKWTKKRGKKKERGTDKIEKKKN